MGPGRFECCYRLYFNNAKELKVSTDKYSVWDGSAGARMSAYIGSYGVKYFSGIDRPRLSAVIMVYYRS